MAKEVNTIGSHFVWRKYLEAFCDTNGKVNCKEIVTGKCFAAQTRNIGKENNIYRLTNKISSEDVDLFKRIMKLKNLNQGDEEALNYLVAFLNNEALPLIKDTTLRNLLNNIMPKDNAQGKQELLFTEYEYNFIPLLDKILKKDVSFYNDLLPEKDKMGMGLFGRRALLLENFFIKEFSNQLMLEIDNNVPQKQKIRQSLKIFSENSKNLMEQKFDFANDVYYTVAHFLIFIITQYFRTRRMATIFKDMVSNINKSKSKNYNEEAFFALVVHFHSHNIAKKMIDSDYKIVLITNHTAIPFITSDQPIVNTYAVMDYDIFSKIEEALELFYPVSPSLAMMFTCRDCYKYVDEITLDENSVKEHNILVEKEAFEFIYSSKSFS